MGEEVVRIELEGLKEYFKKNNTKDYHSTVHSALKSVLSKLPQAVVENCPYDANFHAEIVSAEQAEVAALQATIASMQEQSEVLTGYMEDMNTLQDDYGLWLSSPPTDSSSSSSSS